jgi:decaprenylphospho-beta-D-erythro-pentofuranosid-2-ulose 2-reductase
VKNATAAPQSVLVLGGGSDIGLALVRRLADRLEMVYLAGRDPAVLEGHGSALRRGGVPEVRVVEFDAERVEEHPAVLDKVFGGGDIDLVVLAFGVLPDQAAAERDTAVALRAARTNYLGGLSAGLEAARRLRAQGHGTLVVLSTVAAERPRRSNYIYGSAKAGLDAFAVGLGDSLRGTGVRVLVVRPGFVRSTMTAGLEPAPLATTPEAVADVIADALRRGKEIVWAPPPMRVIMSGLRHLPRGVFRRLPL